MADCCKVTHLGNRACQDSTHGKQEDEECGRAHGVWWQNGGALAAGRAGRRQLPQLALAAREG